LFVLDLMHRKSQMISDSSRQRTGLHKAVLVLIALAVGAAISWAIIAVLAPPGEAVRSADYTFATVTEGDISSSINLNSVAEWSAQPVGSNQASGIVTSIGVQPGQEAFSGSVLYSVNLRPVVVAQGAIPSFRSLQSGTEGEDVRQLQSMLASLGFYTSATDGKFEKKTLEAVKEWQESLDLAADGVVQTGDVIFLESLPSRVSLDTSVVSRGMSLAGGEPVVKGLSATPTFTLPVTAGQVSLVPLGTEVQIQSPSGTTWSAKTSAQKGDETAGIYMELVGIDGASICGDECGLLPVTGQSFLDSKVVTVPEVHGLTIPSAALLSDADGRTTVIDDDSVVHPVDVLGSANGISVITGVSVGTKVRVSGDQQTQ
jgi:peptidoglycan hydrolase-like protein with peptidoglycan-binding domain